MAKKKYQIVGRVVLAGQGVLGLRVEAWDKDLIFDDHVSDAVTGADGSFQMQFDQSHFADLFLESQPDLYFKVFDGDQLIKSTKDSVLWNVAAGKTEVVIELGSGQPKGDKGMSKKLGDKKPVDDKGLKTGTGPKSYKVPKPGKGPKKDKTPKKGKGKKKGKKKGKDQYQSSGSDFVCVIISKKCALELATAISLALGFPVTPGKKKKKGKKKKGKGKKKGGKTSPKKSPKTSPKSPKTSPKTTPKTTPKTSPKTSPKKTSTKKK